MAKRAKTVPPATTPVPKVNPETEPPYYPDYPEETAEAEENPDVIPEDDPFETPPAFEPPSPGEGP